MKNDDRDLELACIYALAGASEVRTRVLSGLSLGFDSVEGAAYLIKCRVKDRTSLLLKVVERRTNGGKSDYMPTDARDIIGLRLLSLFRTDLPDLVSKFLSFVDAGQRDDFSLFQGAEFKDAVEEIIIYTTKPKGDQIDNLVAQEFIGRGLEIDYSDTNDDEKEDSLRVKIKRKDSQYSSIHIILWCRNFIGGHDARPIPMEVQIRTSMEDLWGEIDHKLSYKNDELGSDEASKNHIDSAKEQLKNLKKHLDVVADSADVIKKEIKYATPSSLKSSANISARSVNMGTLVSLPVGDAQKEAIEQLTEDIKITFGSFSRGEYTRKDGGAARLAEEFARIGSDIHDLAENVASDHSIAEQNQAFSKYYLLMESALSYYWAGRVTAGDTDRADAYLEAEKFFETSLAIYSDLAGDSRYANDAILSYRMANVLTAQNQSELALVKLRDAVDELRSHPQPNLAEDHFLRVRIPRQLGVAYWELAERMRLKAKAIGMDDHFGQRRRSLYLDALKVTKPLLDIVVAQPDVDIELGAEEMADEQLKTANNILEYSLCFLRSGGTPSELARLGVSQDELKKIVDLLENENKKDGLQIPVWGDTLRAAYEELLGDLPKAKEIAQQTLALIQKNRKTWNSIHTERIVEEMIEDARRTLDSGLNLV
jgi:ppGpp synthetase/RelA/SpoT-type nucleotidyltranferase